jgi:ABC-type transporter Mla subunit MlaD
MPTPTPTQSATKQVVEQYADQVAALLGQREELFDRLVTVQHALRGARARLDELLAHVATAHATFRQDSER